MVISKNCGQKQRFEILWVRPGYFKNMGYDRWISGWLVCYNICMIRDQQLVVIILSGFK